MRMQAGISSRIWRSYSRIFLSCLSHCVLANFQVTQLINLFVMGS